MDYHENKLGSQIAPPKLLRDPPNPRNRRWDIIGRYIHIESWGTSLVMGDVCVGVARSLSYVNHLALSQPKFSLRVREVYACSA